MTERLHVGGEVSKYCKVGAEQSRATSNDARCFLSADAGKTWAGAIHYDGPGLDRSLQGLHGPEMGWPSDHLPHPQDLGLSIHGIRGDKECQPLAFPAPVQGRHERRLVFRSRPISILRQKRR